MPLQISISNAIGGGAGGGARCAKALPATNIGNTYFTANWQPYTNAYYYEIDLSTDSNFGSFVYENLIVHIINYNYSYEFIGLTPGTTYYYRVRAVVDKQFGVFFDGYTVANSYSEVNTTSDTRSDVFGEFSLLGYPSALYEDVMYTQIPKDDSGNLIFTRASNGTRVAPSGLIGDVPWNNAQYSNAFNVTGYWNVNNNIIKTSAAIANPIDGRMDGWKVEAAANGYFSFYNTNINNGYSQTESIFVKAGSCFVVGLRDGSVTGQEATFNIANGSIISTNVADRWFIEDYGNGWYRIGKTVLGIGAGMRIEFYGNEKFESALAGQFCYIYGYQWAESAIDNPLPYIQTTDRLNVPRLDWKNNQPGILMEGQRTNLIRYSQDLNVTGGIWSPNAGGTITANVATAPDGTESADRLTCNNNTYSGWYQGYTSGRVVNSVYAKYEDRRYLSVVDATGGATGASFDLIDGTVAYVRSNVLAYIENAGNGWYRCVWWENSNGSSYGIIQFWLDSTPGGNGGVSGSCLLWGAQVEPMENISNRTYASSYIRTFATSVTRLADTAITSSVPSLIGQSEGSIFVDFLYRSYRNNSIVEVVKTTSTWLDDIIQIYNNAPGILKASVYSNSVQTVDITSSISIADGDRAKVLFTYKQNEFKFFVNGFLAGTDISGNTPLSLNFARLVSSLSGSSSDSNQPFSKLYSYGLIKRALTNAEAIEITSIGIDPSAAAFIFAAGITDTTQQNAINTFVIGLKSAGLWDIMKIIYPFVGGTAASHKFNLKDPRDLDAAFRLTFSGGWTHNSSGVNGNGVGYAETYFVPSLNGVQNQHIAENQVINNVDANTQEIGVEQSPNGELSHWMRVFGSGTLGRVYGGQGGDTVSDSRGFQVTQREDASNCRQYRYGVFNVPYAASYLGVRPTTGLTLGAKRQGAGIGGYSNRWFNYISVGDSINPSLLDAYSQLVLQFQTDLGR